MGWGMAVMAGAFAVGPFSGAHLNPAVTLGFAVIGNTEWSDVPKYLVGEFVGAFIGAMLVYARYSNTGGDRGPRPQAGGLQHGPGHPKPSRT